METGDPLGPILARQIMATAPLPLAESLTARCDDAYQQTVRLREVALAATRRSVDLYRKADLEEPESAELATRLNNLGNRLRDLGRREDALEATREAVDILRQLAQSRPDAFDPDLATSLDNLGVMLSDLGRRDDALNATREAVETLAPFVLRHPRAFESWVPTMLRNYRQAAEAAGQEPDAALLQPIHHALELLEKQPLPEDTSNPP